MNGSQILTGIQPNIATVEQQGKSPAQPKYTQTDEFFLRLRQRLLKKNEQAWLHDYRSWLKAHFLYIGQHLLRPWDYGVGFDVIPVSDSDPIHVLNKFGFYSDDFTNQAMMSNPLIEIAALTSSTDEERRIVRASRALQQHYVREHWTAYRKQELIKGGQFCGNYHAQVVYDRNAPGMEKRPVFGKSQLPGAAVSTCVDCSEVYPEETHSCPACGGQTYVETAPGVEFETIQGFEMVSGGDLVCEIVPAWQIRRERGLPAWLTPWRVRVRDILSEEFRAQFPDWKRESEKSVSTGDDTGLHPDRILRTVSEAIDRGEQRIRLNSGEDDGYITIEEWFFAPQMYANDEAVLRLPEMRADGTQIPAGTKLSEAYPKGLYRVHVKGERQCVYQAEEEPTERWIDQVFNVVPGRGIGHNVSDAMEYQRQRNIINSIRLESYRRAGSPVLVVNGSVIQASAMLRKPGGIYTIEAGRMGQEGRVDQAWSMIPYAGPDPTMIEYNQELDAGQQTAMKSLLSQQGALPGVKNDTATAARIAEARAASAPGLHLELLADFYRQHTGKVLALAQRYFQYERILHLTGKDGTLEARSFQAADLKNARFVLSVRPGSHLPETPLTRQMTLQAEAEVYQMLAASGQVNEQTVHYLDEVFNGRLSGEDTTNDDDWVSRALESLTQAASVLGEQQEMPRETAIQAGSVLADAVRVSPFELGNDRKAHLLREWLSSDKGQESDDLLRGSVEALILRLAQAKVEEQAFLIQAQMAAMPPEMMAQEDASPSRKGQPTQLTARQEREQQDQGMSGNTGTPSQVQESAG